MNTERMLMMRGFFSWIKNLSSKQTIVLVGLAVTLYLHFSQGLVLTLTRGESGALFMSLGIWISIVISISIIGLFMLLLVYGIKLIVKAIKDKFKNRKAKTKA